MTHLTLTWFFSSKHVHFTSPVEAIVASVQLQLFTFVVGKNPSKHAQFKHGKKMLKNNILPMCPSIQVGDVDIKP